jgi:hypothetical protein
VHRSGEEGYSIYRVGRFVECMGQGRGMVCMGLRYSMEVKKGRPNYVGPGGGLVYISQEGCCIFGVRREGHVY